MEAQDRERERSDEPSQFSYILKSSARKKENFKLETSSKF